MNERPRAVDIALAAVLPLSCLVADPGGWMPFGPAKWAATSVCVAIAVVLGLRTEGPTLPPWVRWTGLGLLGWLLITAALGPEPIAAWIGTPDRHFGWATIALFAALFVAAVRAGHGAVRAVSVGAMVALAGIAVWCVAEWAGWPPIRVAADNGRLVGPFGSSAFTGAALVLLVPIVVAVAADSQRTRGLRVVAAAVVALSTVAVFGTASRAALVGLAIAGGVALAAHVRLARLRTPEASSPEARTPEAQTTSPRRIAAITAGVGLVVVLGVMVGPARARLASADAADGRVDEWRVAARTVVAHPVVGLGPEGYRTEFPRRVDRAYVQSHGREATTDRAHDALLDVGLMGGLPAIVMFVAIAGFVAVRSWGAAGSGSGTLAGMGAASIGLLAHQLLFFPSAEIDPMFWVVSGVVVGAMATTEAARRVTVSAAAVAPDVPPTVVGRVVAVVAGVVAAIALVAGVADVLADRSSAQALDLAAEGRYADAAAAADRAVLLRPDSFRYRLVAATVPARRGTVPALRAAIRAADDAIRLAPADPVLALRRAGWLARLAAATGEDADARDALAEWRVRAAEDPLQPEVYMGWGETSALVGDVAGTEARFATARELLPARVEPWARLAAAEVRLGRLDAAERAVAEALAIDPADPLARDAARLVDEAQGS